ncbi:two-component sensor histidine kinase [Qipengyuania sp. 1NDW9]|uniref:sensor histidine kinase n=1 Tax=Qipengyuania xiapuensis TaxID=2867236 RepID=UPI001C86E694|nr:ATP-binding protein [Qipengyuania xiapuensis]MBX7491960.1 two-component sensor histidine kinase [Qipengyuania xiapuensis]
MKRFLPKSLLGQLTLALGLTLFIVQGVNGFLAYSIEKDRVETALVNTLSLRLVASARFADDPLVVEIDPRRSARDAEERRPQRRPGPNRRRFANTDFRQADTFEILPVDVRRPELEERLAENLRDNGRTFSDIRVIERPVAADPVSQRFLLRFAMRRGLTERDLPKTVALAGISDGEGWEIVRAPVRDTHRHFGPAFPLLRAAALTLLLSFILWLVLRRLTGPLAQLTRQTERFAASPGQYEPIEPRGPEDVKRLITAHNAMEARIGAMLEEKDVMLGAIGHDLKTPLAALRVRVESVEDETARARMVDSIENITLTLDEILALARVGKSNELPERTDLAALAASIVEEFEDMGEEVTLDAARVVAPVHLTWLKRGLRNLVSNALRYGGDANVSIAREGDEAILRVEDNGPGIPEDRIAEMLEPFTRGEASRNRATGGAGLGLTLARAVAEQHGGTLTLSNRPEGGLRAEFRLPL